MPHPANVKNGMGEKKMYKCEIHGEVENGWCNECEKVIQCDCSDTDSSRIKDVSIGTDVGEKICSIYIEYCKTCGNIIDVHLYSI